MRDEDAATYRSCAFVGNFAALALGTHSGEVRLHDTLSGDVIDTWDAHEAPVYQLRVGRLFQPPGGLGLLGLCGRTRHLPSAWLLAAASTPHYAPYRANLVAHLISSHSLQTGARGYGHMRGRRPATIGLLACKPQAWMHIL